MLRGPKRRDHVEDDDDLDEPETDEDQKINFAWIVAVAMDMGYTEEEVSRMYYEKWNAVFAEYRKLHNFKTKQGLWGEEKKRVSPRDL